MNEYTKLALNHAFEGVQSMVVIFTKTAALYFAIMAIYFGVLNADLGSGQIIANLKVFCLLATVAIMLIFGLFHLLIARGIRFYFRHAYTVCTPSMEGDLRNVEKDVLRLGTLLSVIGQAAFSLALVLLFQSG